VKYDRFISSKLRSEVTEKLPKSKLKVIDQSGHYVHMDKPQELIQVVTEFFDQQSS
jgi:pimeloyl-ACP methyl ester carboxylesterase